MAAESNWGEVMVPDPWMLKVQLLLAVAVPDCIRCCCCLSCAAGGAAETEGKGVDANKAVRSSKGSKATAR